MNALSHFLCKSMNTILCHKIYWNVMIKNLMEFVAQWSLAERSGFGLQSSFKKNFRMNIVCLAPYRAVETMK